MRECYIQWPCFSDRLSAADMECHAVPRQHLSFLFADVTALFISCNSYVKSAVKCSLVRRCAKMQSSQTLCHLLVSFVYSTAMHVYVLLCTYKQKINP